MALDLKMDKKKLGILVGAIAAGLVAAVLVNNYVQDTLAQQQAALLAQAASKQDVQALFERLQRVERDNQQLVANVKKLAAEQARRPVQRDEEGQPVALATLSMKTPPGKRAITAKVDKLYASEGLVNPGDYVDILVHLDVPVDPFNEKATEDVAIMLFQNVQVLAMETSLEPKAGDPGNVPQEIPVTFALNPQEASMMSFAQKKGKLQLAVRSPKEKQLFALPAATWESLSDYVQETQGLDLGLWGEKEEEPSPDVDIPEYAPPIQVFRGGG